MLLVELLKEYAGRHKTDQAIYKYLDTEDQVVRFDTYIRAEEVTDEWIQRFSDVAGKDHARRVRKVIKYFQKLVFR